MKPKGSIFGATLAFAVLTGASLWSLQIQAQSVSFAVDPYWQKPLPDNWVTGVVGGTCVTAQNHIFIVTQGFQTGGLASPEGVGGAIISGPNIGTVSPSKASPPVLEFDQNGYVVNSWGNPALVATGLPFAGQNAVLPNGIHGCFVDSSGNVWIAGTADGVVQKYSAGGTLMMTIGTKFACDDGLGGSIACTGTGGGNVARTGISHTLLNGPADVAVDATNGDVYIADGYGNHRVVVFDKNGNYLRQMGGVGTTAGAFASAGGGHPNCVVLPNNGLVYACDRGNDRINVYQKDGTYVTAIPVVPGTAALSTAGTFGSATDIAFSPDAAQAFMYVSDGGNERVWIINHAAALVGTPNSIVGSFGNGFGHDTGEFTFLDMITADSLGNAYTAETTGGRRQQRFVRQ